MADTQGGYIYNAGSCNLVNGSLWNTALSGLHKVFCESNKLLDPKTVECNKHAHADSEGYPTYVEK